MDFLREVHFFVCKFRFIGAFAFDASFRTSAHTGVGIRSPLRVFTDCHSQFANWLRNDALLEDCSINRNLSNSRTSTINCQLQSTKLYATILPNSTSQLQLQNRKLHYKSSHSQIIPKRPPPRKFRFIGAFAFDKSEFEAIKQKERTE